MGRIWVLTEMRDTIGLIAMSLGIGIEDPTYDALKPAFDKLEEETANGQIRQFTGNEYVGPLEEGTLAACIAWSGDVLGMNNPNVKFAVPDAGGTLWFDTMVIPKGASNVPAVAEWMDFVYDPENAARITEAVQFISPVAGVQEVLRAKGGEAAAVADNPLVFPDEATQERLQIFGLLDEDTEQRMDEEFARISGA
jgi:spermidine/putrescine transport system substrate-binding protein